MPGSDTNNNKLDRPIEFHRRDTSRIDAALRRPNAADGNNNNNNAATTDKNGVEFSRIPSPSSKSGIRPRRTFGKTSTLSGAFEATAPQPQQETQQQQQQVAPPEEVPEYDRKLVSRGTPSPSHRRRKSPSSSTNPAVDISSPPELQETYRQINDSDDLAQDDFEQLLSNPVQVAELRRRKSKSPVQQRDGVERQQQHQQLGRDRNQENYQPQPTEAQGYGSGLSFPSDDTDDSFRNKLEKHAMDEQRLKYATGKDSPVFSRARAGQSALRAAGNLQRRSAEELKDGGRVEDDGGPEPALNIPKAWGGRGQASKERMSYISRRNLEREAEKLHSEDIKTEPEPALEPEAVQDWENDTQFTARDLQVSDSPPVQQNLVPAREQTDALARKTVTNKRLGELGQKYSQERLRQSIEEGDPIPNTPIVVYKNNSNYDKKIERTDSRDILRELAMRESPTLSSSNTPEQKSPEKKDIMLAKTPVVTGAWIDTPMTERVADLPEDLTKDIISPSPSRTAPKPEKKGEGEKQPVPEQKPSSKASSHRRSESLPEPAKDSSQPSSKPSTKTRTKPRRQLEKPKIPKSALETVLENAKSDDNTLTYGEDTIDSLQEILDQEPSIFSPDGGNNDEESDGTSVSANTVTDLNHPSLDPLNTKLQSLLRSIHDAQQGLSTLEHQITSEATARTSEKKKSKPLKSSKPTTTHPHDPSTCETCGLHNHDRRLYIALPLPRLWKRSHPTYRLRPTRLGYFLLISLTWYITELIMCDFHCHQFYAHTCTPPCIRPNAPRMPWVLPTMLYRWSGLQHLFAPFWMLVVAVTRFMLQVCGMWDGYVEDGVGGAYWANRPWRKDPVANEVPVMGSWGHERPVGNPAWDSGISMDEDELV
ncbi:hypothetical protein FQN54_004867 [Arachnomyces sp. PD_36]|nr:hypothetical protein FQN54_004867 [Arachnomyces sp. PD_36]